MTLDRIDPAASALGEEFWGEFLAEVGMGIYATKNILRDSKG